MEKIVFTIGHSTHSIEHFISLLNQHNINCVVDVRSTPVSKYATQFNQNSLKYYLREAGIKYIYMGEEFGARRDDKSLYDADGKLDFEKTAQSEMFIKGINRILDGLDKGYKIALMCAEKRPEECHRCILVGRNIDLINGIQVEHILEDGRLKTQTQIAEELKLLYFSQTTIDTIIKSDEELIDMAYKKREKEIAFQL